ncbi:MAG: aminopeptidase P family protein [Bacteroidota bacterium]
MSAIIPTDIYIQRRKILLNNVKEGLIFLPGNRESPMNYPDNTYHFRQDSHFLYYIGIDRPDLSVVLDTNSGETILFGDNFTLDMIVWLGALPTLESLAEKSGIVHVKPTVVLADYLSDALNQGRNVHILPPYRAENMLLINDYIKKSNKSYQQLISEELIRQVVAQRSIKDAYEIQEMIDAVNISGKMHVAAMIAAKAGMFEYELTGLVEGISVGNGGRISYPVILTTQGQTLHNHSYSGKLKEGGLVLGDFGSESAGHYAGDITRTFPVSKSFSSMQRDIYEIVLDTEIKAIHQIKPGISYKDIHLQAALNITEGLIQLGLMKGNPQDAVAAGAHALFFPHGLGHMIGLDVHDMEDLGEAFVGYDASVSRSTQFGLKSLRLGKKLEEGFVLTVEPGIYFIPQLMYKWENDKMCSDFICYEKLPAYRDFTGVRIEDNVLVVPEGHKILGNPIPKSISEVEALRS